MSKPLFGSSQYFLKQETEILKYELIQVLWHKRTHSYYRSNLRVTSILPPGQDEERDTPCNVFILRPLKAKGWTGTLRKNPSAPFLTQSTQKRNSSLDNFKDYVRQEVTVVRKSTKNKNSVEILPDWFNPLH